MMIFNSIKFSLFSPHGTISQSVLLVFHSFIVKLLGKLCQKRLHYCMPVEMQKCCEQVATLLYCRYNMNILRIEIKALLVNNKNDANNPILLVLDMAGSGDIKKNNQMANHIAISSQ